MKIQIKINHLDFFYKKQRGETKTKNNNSWYKYDGNSDTVIIFVHGVLSDSKSCWTSKNGVFWPDIVLKDPRFNNPSIFLAGYHTEFDSTSYKIRDCADELIRALERTCINGTPAPIEYTNIIFVCHSLGGIITRYMLDAYTQKFSKKTIALSLMASPSIGSEYANTLSGIINFYRNDIGKQLVYMSEALTELDDRFRTLISEQRIPNLVGSEAIEHHFLYRIRILPGFQPVVKKESAARYFSSQKLRNTNHFTIVKPETNEAPGHQFLVDLIQNQFNKKKQKHTPRYEISRTDTDTGVTKQKEGKASVSTILFDIYNKNCLDYYAERSIDEYLKNSLSVYSLWISGPSGCGKTTSVRHLLYENGHSPLEICLAACHGDLTSVRVINEIYATALQRYSGCVPSSVPTLSSLATLLAENTKNSSVILYLDEVPINCEEPEQIEELVNLIAKLLDTVKHISGRDDIRFVISSITPPIEGQLNPGKFAEQMLPVPMKNWTEDELYSLLEKLRPYLSINNFESAAHNELICVADGSPRFLKMYLKNRFREPGKSHAEILKITRDQYIT